MSPTRSLRRHRMALSLAAFAGVLTAAPASAKVIEIASDGVVTVRAPGPRSVWQPSEVTTLVEQSDPQPTKLVDAPLTMVGEANVPAAYAAHLHRAAAAADISPALLAALVWQESRWNAGAVSPRGAVGLTQLMPATARELGVDPNDALANLTAGARYLRRQLDAFGGNVEKALAAYNAGPGRVRRANGIPAIRETQNYVAAIVQRIAGSPASAPWLTRN